jgi:selenocysteine lyase/cysteine desulfurase
MTTLASNHTTYLTFSAIPRLKNSNAMHLTLTDQPEMITREGTLEKWFSRFRGNIIGLRQFFETPFGEKQILYADWTASGRAYGPIEECLQREIMPFVGNTHTNTTVTGTLMSRAYEEAKLIIKEHVNASSDDVLLFCGSGMTAAVNKLQRILGLRLPGRAKDYTKNGYEAFPVDEALRPVVFVTHMEHHSNHTSWLETIATVEIIQPDDNGNVDLKHFRSLLEKFSHRKNKIAAITACSNVTGIETLYHDIARVIHEYGGLCVVDFAGSAPYVDMNMHPAATDEHLDAIYFSAHKFLGGPGTPGVLVFNKKIYKNSVPDQPGGGTIIYSNPWKVHKYITDIEQREDGGTPPFLQGIKAAMCIRLKEAMGVENIRRREEEMLRIVFDRFSKIKNVKVLEGHIEKRLGVISFIVDGAHHDLFVRMLNDRFGIQTRGGCSCAGTYGHKLLQVDEARSYEILNSILSGDLLTKPGWIRLSVHPTMTNAEVSFIMDAIELTASRFEEWAQDYVYDYETNEYSFKGIEITEQGRVEGWFKAVGWGTFKSV